MPVAVPRPARRGLGPRGRRRIAGAGLGALLVATAGFVARPAGGAVGHRLASTVMHRSALRAAAAPTCLKAAPTTAGGYAAMFAALDPRQWGGGDLAISVPLDGRTGWLFGDTGSTNPLVHSTAVGQAGR